MANASNFTRGFTPASNLERGNNNGNENAFTITGPDQAQRQGGGAPQEWGLQGGVCQLPHDRMEEGPLWTSSWQQNGLHLTWWKMHDDAEQQRA